MLFLAMDRGRIVYSHWKGNARLHRALEVADDLDLLVPDATFAGAEAALRSLGFKVAVPRVEPPNDFAKHYYGYDAPSDRLVHVHLYQRVVMGENFVDSHELPFGAMLTQGTERYLGVRIPSAAAESIVFVLKTYIRYGSCLDEVARARSARDDREELSWLDPESHLEESMTLLAKYCPDVEGDLYERCVVGLTRRWSRLRRQRLSAALRRRLRRYERHRWWRRVLAKTGFLLRKAAVKLRLRRSGKTLPGRGRTVALVGSRNETVQAAVELGRWLGSAFAVRTIDLSYPDASELSLWVRTGGAIGKRFAIARGRWAVRRGEVVITCATQDLPGGPTSAAAALRPDRTLHLPRCSTPAANYTLAETKAAVWEAL